MDASVLRTIFDFARAQGASADGGNRVTLDGCYKFHSVRETDGEKVDGWVQMGQQARGSGCPF